MVDACALVVLVAHPARQPDGVGKLTLISAAVFHHVIALDVVGQAAVQVAKHVARPIHSDPTKRAGVIHPSAEAVGAIFVVGAFADLEAEVARSRLVEERQRIAFVRAPPEGHALGQRRVQPVGVVTQSAIGFVPLKPWLIDPCLPRHGGCVAVGERPTRIRVVRRHHGHGVGHGSIHVFGHATLERRVVFRASEIEQPHAVGVVVVAGLTVGKRRWRGHVAPTEHVFGGAILADACLFGNSLSP